MSRLPILTAPTAAGKSALALHLAAQWPVEIVSADAFTVYRGLDVGTAKPSPGERARTPHHLIDVVDVTEPFDVARFVTLAESAIAATLARGRVPLIVGGTGFYLAALTRGLPLTPPSDPQARAAVEADLLERGLDALLGEIRREDPAEERRMERNPRRVVRAVELLRRTGRLPGHYGRSVPRHEYTVTAFTMPPDDLHARMQARIHGMFDQGWPEEAAWLATRTNPLQQPRPTVWQALGYEDALATWRGDLSRADAEERILLASRQYAKRQLTFTRTQLHAAVHPNSGGAASELSDILGRWHPSPPGA